MRKEDGVIVKSQFSSHAAAIASIKRHALCQSNPEQEKDPPSSSVLCFSVKDSRSSYKLELTDAEDGY